MTQRGAWTPQKVRDRIRTGVLVKRLFDHSVGRLELTQTQVRAAEILLRKCVPDLARTEVQGEVKADVNLVSVVFKNAPKSEP